MPYRASNAGFEFSIGSTIRGILPASVQSAFVGSLLVMAFLFATYAGDMLEPSIVSIAGVIMFAFVLMFFGLIFGTLFCAFYIGIFGSPVAMLLGERIERIEGRAFAILAALVASVIASALLMGGRLDPSRDESWYSFFMVLAYAAPAAHFYRQSVIEARELSDLI